MQLKPSQFRILVGLVVTLVTFPVFSDNKDQSPPSSLRKAEVAEATSSLVATAATTSATTTTTSIIASPPQSWQNPQDVNNAGAFTYSYPIKLPEGTAGLRPSLSLDYNSAAPNGALGTGFSLSGVSVIERDLSYPVTFASTDHYVLDGQKLFFGPGTAFHPEREDYSRIQVFYRGTGGAQTDPNNVAAYWVVQKKDGTTYYYGDYTGRTTSSTNLATIPAIGYSTPRCWALSKVQDANGNFYTFNYYYDPAGTGAYYLLNIVYTQGTGISTYKTVQFSYETRLDHGAMYQPSKVDLDHRLSWISVLVGTDVNGSGGSLLRKYYAKYASDDPAQAGYRPSKIVSLRDYGTTGTIPPSPWVTSAYPIDESGTVPVDITWKIDQQSFSTSPDWATFLLSSFSLTYSTTADFDGDGFLDLLLQCYSSNSNTTYWKVLRSNGSSFDSGTNWTLTTTPGVTCIGVADVNSDGRSDLILQYDLGGYRYWQARTSNGTSFVYTGDWTLTSTPGVSCVGLSDVDADGRADLVLQYDSGGYRYWQPRVSNGTSFVNKGDWTFTSTPNVSCIGLPDVNGDGKADLVLQYDSGGYRYWQPRVSSGSSFVNTGDWTFTSTPNVSCIGLSDVNADGKADLVLQYDSAGYRYWQPRVSTGTSFVNTGDWSYTSTPAVSSSGLADTNNDGKADLILQFDDNQTRYWQVRGSSGAKLFFAGNWSSEPTANGYQCIGLSDMTGDGSPDLLLQYDSAGYRKWQVRKMATTGSGLIDSITLSSGGTISPTYTATTQIPVVAAISQPIAPANSVYPTVADVGPRMVVTQVKYSDAVSPTNDVVVKYDYYNGLRRSGTPDQRRNLGFQKVTKTVGTSVTETTYSQDPVTHGMPVKIVVKDTSGTVFSQKDTTYVPAEGTGTHNAPNFIAVAKVWNKSFDGQATPIQTLTTMEYDSNTTPRYGNLTKVTDWSYVNASGTPIDLSSGSSSNQGVTETNYEYASTITASDYLFKLTRQKVLSYAKAASTLSIENQVDNYYDNQGFGVLGTKGQLTKTVAYLNGNANDPTTTYTYDSWGNIDTIKDPRVNSGEYTGVTKSFTYDSSYHSQVKTTTDARGRITTTNYDTLMRPISMVDSNGQYWFTNYDPFGRVGNTVSPGDYPVGTTSLPSPTTPTTVIEYYDGDPTSQPVKLKWVHTTQRTSATTPGLESYTFLDGLGRTIETKKSGVGGWIVQDWYYDTAGRNAQVSMPYLNTATSATTLVRDPAAKLTSYTFDALDRVTQVTHPDGTNSRTIYAQNKVTSIDENAHATQVENDGNTVINRTYLGTYSAAPTGAAYSTTTTKKYQGLVEVLENSTQVSATTFDPLGRRTGFGNADQGGVVSYPGQQPWQYGYDNNGNLKSQTDAKSTTTTYTYDNLNRPLTRTNAPDATINVTWTYDEAGHGEAALGRLTTVTYNNGNDSLSYDLKGRIKGQSRTLAAKTKTETFTYDSADRLVTNTLPTGEAVTSTYGADGNLITLAGTTSYVSGVSYNPLGKVKTMTYGNNVGTVYNYYDDATVDATTGRAYSYRLRQIQVGTGGAVLNASYTYDPTGNVATRSDNNTSYQYDELNRLIGTKISGVATNSYAYDTANNLITMTEGGTVRNYPVGSKPHQVSGLTYDPNGNLTTNGARTITFDADNRVKSVSDDGSYTYDAGRQRTVKTVGTKTTYYFFPDYEEDYDTVPDISLDYHQNAWATTDNWYAADAGPALDASQGTLKVGSGGSLGRYMVIPVGKTIAMRVRTRDNTTRSANWVGWNTSTMTNTLSSGFTISGSWTVVSASFTSLVSGQNLFQIYQNNIEIDWISIGVDFRSFIKANGITVAQSGPQGVSFIHADHLGSSTKMTNTAGSVIQGHQYQPYGNDVAGNPTGTGTTKYQFTGQERDAEGIYYYNARYYDPTLGRFIQPDPAVYDGQYYGKVNLALAEQANSYLYCLDSPVSYTDPTGLNNEGVWGLSAMGPEGFVAAAVLYTALNYPQIEAGVKGVVSGISGALESRGKKTNDLPESGIPGSTTFNPPGSKGRRFGSDGTPEQDWNKLHPGYPGLEGEIDHVHDWKPRPPEATEPGKGQRQPARAPSDQEAKDWEKAKQAAEQKSQGGGSSSATTEKGKSIICTELHRQGLMDDATYAADGRFGYALESRFPLVLKGYRFWAAPIVRQMGESKEFTRLVFVFGEPWAKEMSYLMGENPRGDIFGLLLMVVGIPFSGLIGIVISIPEFLWQAIALAIVLSHFFRLQHSRRLRIGT